MKQDKPSAKPLNSFIKYSSLGFQLGAIIGVFTYVGSLLDDYYQLENSAFTTAGALIGVLGGLTSVIVKLLRETQD